MVTYIAYYAFRSAHAHGEQVRPLVSPDGSRIATLGGDVNGDGLGHQDRSAAVFTLGDSDTDRACGVQPGRVTRIVTCRPWATAKVWDAKTGAEVCTLGVGTPDFINSASFNPDGSRIVTASLGQDGEVWDAKTGTEILVLNNAISEASDSTFSASFSPDGTRIVGLGGDAVLRLGRRLPPRSSPRKDSPALEDQLGTRVVTGGLDGTAKVWDAKTAAEVHTLKRAHR